MTKGETFQNEHYIMLDLLKERTIETSRTVNRHKPS